MNNKRVASVKFTGRTERERYAEQVFAHYLELPDVDDPLNGEKRMRPQHILIEALCALGKRLESEGIVLAADPEDFSALRNQFDTGIQEIKESLADMKTKIDQLQAQGTLTAVQADRVRAAVEIDPALIDDAFAKNISKTLRPGRTKVDNES